MSVIGQEKGIAHGTLKGYKQHRYRKVASCEACLQAVREDNARRAPTRTRKPKPAEARRIGAYDKELATHCSKGHEWTQENTQIRHRIMRGKPHRSRVCRACEHDRSVARQKAKKEAMAA